MPAKQGLKNCLPDPSAARQNMQNWGLARATLEAYFNRNLSQVSAIFWLCAFIMLIGFGIIIWGVFLAIKTPESTLLIIVTGLAGVVTELIGATFLFVYRSIMQQAIRYSKTLERLYLVEVAIQIVETMPRNQTKNFSKAEIVAKILENFHEVNE